MLTEKAVKEITGTYKTVRIGVLGSHSAEEVGVAAKAAGFETVIICQKGRESLYATHNKFLFDHIIVLDKFSDIISPEVQKKLRDLNVVFIPNRPFAIYVGCDNIENKFEVPIYGNRFILRAEERTGDKNQYWLMKRAGIRMPKMFKPSQIDRLSIVKVSQKHRPLERAFFYPVSPEDYDKKSRELIEKDIVDEKALKDAVIEEYILGQKFNANFHAYALEKFGKFDFVGFDDRKQTNLSGIRDLPAAEQLKIDVPIKNEEIGHYGLTMRESQKHLVYEAAEKFIDAVKKEFHPGLFGLFALQGAIAEDPDTHMLDFFVFDLSPRIPGCPCVGPTSPEMRRLSLKHGKQIESPLDITMIEINTAFKNNQLKDIVT